MRSASNNNGTGGGTVLPLRHGVSDGAPAAANAVGAPASSAVADPTGSPVQVKEVRGPLTPAERARVDLGARIIGNAVHNTCGYAEWARRLDIAPQNAARRAQAGGRRVYLDELLALPREARVALFTALLSQDAATPTAPAAPLPRLIAVGSIQAADVVRAEIEASMDGTYSDDELERIRDEALEARDACEAIAMKAVALRANRNS